MLIDNENKNYKVHEWIAKYTETGKLDIVTGYFTVGALAYLSKTTNEKIERFRFVLGDIVNVDEVKDRALDLMNENISVEAALKLSQLAKEAVEFLKQENVEAKTLEPNFCHAKAYLHAAKNDDRWNYFISGSSNLTEAGVGLKSTNNIELNIGETGNNAQYNELTTWFETLWTKPQAHKNKTVKDGSGKVYSKPFKEYLIGEIERIFIEYTPREIYYKVLFELFGEQLLIDQDDPEFNRQIGRLENSTIYQTLYKFQQKGVLSLIKMLQKYNGAILADAVGLGKTWSALAVMKFFQLQGREIILLCPKKLQNNWTRFRKHQNSKFEKDQFDYFVRFHTDLKMELMDKDLYKIERADTLFTNDRPKLFVIDESHNLRNDKSNRYRFFVDEILRKNEDAKVLMLSATPINNSLNDIRNQLKLIVKGNPGGFYKTLGIKHIDYAFRTAQRAFNDWRNEDNPKISEFIKDLPDNFFKLTDALTVARTRAMINGQESELVFPTKEKPDNLFVTPNELGNFESFEELFKKFPPMLCGYQPAFYAEPMEEKKKRQDAKNKGESTVSILDDEIQRDKFLVKMMYILMVKRLESSWHSFYSTVSKIEAHHQNALKKIKLYQLGKKNAAIIDDDHTRLFGDDESDDEIIEFTLGKKRIINLSDIDKAGNLNLYKRDLKKDIDALDNILANLARFEKVIGKEITIPGNIKSEDTKLEVLIRKIQQKRASGENNHNQKLVIFTVYRDTAEYLFKQLKARGFDKIGFVSGTGSKTTDSDEEHKNFEPILERFAPYTKLFREKEWRFEPSSDDLTDLEKYQEWIQWISENEPKTYNQLQNPIDILIATDALSEGQNLQDADMVINYDIHWNPVRIIQRMGRIDRLGSPNNKIFGVNFWPSNNINSYLDLQGRIEQRMAAMQLAGSEVHLDFSDTFKEMAEDENLENRMKARMMEQMQTSWDDIEVNEQGLGFNDLSLEKYRQDLLEEYNANSEKYSRMPKAVYTGFKAVHEACSENGMIALLGYPSKPPKVQDHIYQSYNLIYINQHGEPVLLNQKEVLDALTLHKDESRFVPAAIDRGEEKAIQNLVSSIKAWLKKQAIEEEKQEDGTTRKKMGAEAKDLLSKLKTGDKDALKRIQQNVLVSDKFQPDNFDLIAWFLVTN
ncbi:MAG: SNF2-related protein [Bacteroidales bacterium]|nr:SNF2-related protein [Bacteroidales bacterium]